MICEAAPAKINLTLEILGKREDGYHEIRSVMQTIDLCDILTFWENEWLHIVPEYGSLPRGDTLFETDMYNYMGENLVYRAAHILKEETGYSGGAIIQLKKNIPSSAGLGGGSSDAAATLRGLNLLWKLDLSREKLMKIGAKIGSDVAFFIHGGTCLIEGRGEIVRPINSLLPKWVLVLPIPLKLEQKTKRLYSYIDSTYYTGGKSTSGMCRMINGCHEGGDSAGCSISDGLFNVFEKVYHNGHGEFETWKRYITRLGIEDFSLAGSGPAVYCIAESQEELLRMAASHLHSRKQISRYIARTVP